MTKIDVFCSPFPCTHSKKNKWLENSRCKVNFHQLETPKNSNPVAQSRNGTNSSVFPGGFYFGTSSQPRFPQRWQAIDGGIQPHISKDLMEILRSPLRWLGGNPWKCEKHEEICLITSIFSPMFWLFSDIFAMFVLFFRFVFPFRAFSFAGRLEKISMNPYLQRPFFSGVRIQARSCILPRQLTPLADVKFVIW